MSLGIGQILLILVVVLIIFGAGKLPHVMKDLAKGLKAFKEGLHGEEEPSALTTTKSSSSTTSGKSSKKTSTRAKKTHV